MCTSMPLVQPLSLASMAMLPLVRCSSHRRIHPQPRPHSYPSAMIPTTTCMFATTLGTTQVIATDPHSWVYAHHQFQPLPLCTLNPSCWTWRCRGPQNLWKLLWIPTVVAKHYIVVNGLSQCATRSPENPVLSHTPRLVHH